MSAQASGATVVFQAWVGPRPPRFIERCLASTRAWALSRGFEYRMLGDEFFDVLPGWYRESMASHVVQQTDLARLRYARDVLDAGAARAIWIDADVLVFDPGAFELEAPEGFALCREVWLQPGEGGLATVFVVNQAIVVADRLHPLLDSLILATETLVRDRPQAVQRFGTGTKMLTWIHRATPIPLLTNLAMMNPIMLREIARGDAGPVTREYVRRHGYPTQAANLTLSMVGDDHQGVRVSEEECEAAIDVLLSTKGAPLDLARALDAS